MKRFNNFDDNAGKKIKLDDDDLWGDDPDLDDIDDCLLRATQICENEVEVNHPQDVSIMPSYNSFQFKKPVSSTQEQLNQSYALARPLNGIQTDTNDLQARLKALQVNLEAKEGEVTILRSQMKQAKETHDSENAKRQRELSEKLNSTKRDRDEAVTKLELKNLEVANLKRKLSDVTKNVTKDLMMTQSFSKSKACSSAVTENTNQTTSDTNVEPLHRKVYPLKHIAQSSIFKPSAAVHSGNTDIFVKNGRHLLSGIRENICMFKEGSAGERIDLRLEDAFPEIAALLNCNEQELELRDDCIGKVTIIFMQFLDEIWVYLKRVESQIQDDCIRRWDLEYLNDIGHPLECDRTLFDSEPWCPEERGIRCRQLVALIAEILPYNTYLRNYVTEEGCTLYRHRDFLGTVKLECSYNEMSNYEVLNRILCVVRKIRQMRKSFKFCGFLAAVSYLIRSICQTTKTISPEFCDHLHSIIREIIFSRPSPFVLNNIIYLLQEASAHPSLIAKLCNQPKNNSLKEKSKKGIYVINKGCCTFQVFSLLYRECLCKETRLNVKKHLSTLEFVFNAFKSNARWLYFQENEHNDCLSELYHLTLEVISTILEIDEKESNFIDALDMSTKVFHLISSECYDILDRKVGTYGQYKNVKMKLLEKCSDLQFSEYDTGAMQKLMKNSMEEPQQLEKDFKNIINYSTL